MRECSLNFSRNCIVNVYAISKFQRKTKIADKSISRVGSYIKRKIWEASLIQGEFAGIEVFKNDEIKAAAFKKSASVRLCSFFYRVYWIFFHTINPGL